ncbi:MAG: hypothetical protein ABJL55_05945 [Roseibium sp.]
MRKTPRQLSSQASDPGFGYRPSFRNGYIPFLRTSTKPSLVALSWLVTVFLIAAAPVRADGILPEVQAILAQPDRLPLIVEKRRRDITRFYNSDDAQVLWLGHPRSHAITDVMASAQLQGLRPEDYPYGILIEAARSLDGPLSPAEKAWVELLFSSHFLDFASDLRTGRVSPRILYPDAYMPLNEVNALDALGRLAKAEDFDSFLTDWQPQDDTYRRLKEHLAHLYDIRSAGGFTFQQPDETTLVAGTSDPRIPDLRRRLFEDELLTEASGSQDFDKRLAFAVGQAQFRYGLPLSGSVSRTLIQALNIPVDRRIEQVTNAMERIRWIPNQYSRLQMLINKGENHYVFVENGRVIREGLAFANCPDRNYTTTATAIEAVTFHPTWQVSWEFLGKELLPRLQSDPNAVEDQGYYMRRGGAEVPLSAVPWKQVTPNTLDRIEGNFSIFLPSSIENPLGRYAYRVRREERLILFDLPQSPDGDTYCNPFLPKTAFGIVEGLDILKEVIEPRVFPPSGVPDRLSRGDTITYPARSGLMAVVTHQSAWIQRQGIIRFGKDPYLEDARLTAALSGRPKP